MESGTRATRQGPTQVRRLAGTRSDAQRRNAGFDVSRRLLEPGQETDPRDEADETPLTDPEIYGAQYVDRQHRLMSPDSQTTQSVEDGIPTRERSNEL
jgi:hypothetical protein